MDPSLAAEAEASSRVVGKAMFAPGGGLPLGFALRAVRIEGEAGLIQQRKTISPPQVAHQAGKVVTARHRDAKLDGDGIAARFEVSPVRLVASLTRPVFRGGENL